MSDPFSVGAAIVGVLSLTIQVTGLVWKLGLDLKQAPKEIRNFMLEVQALQQALSEVLTRLVFNHSFEDAFEGTTSALLTHLKTDETSKIQQSLFSTKQQLTKILNELESSQSGHRLGWDRLRALFTTKQAGASIAELQRQCEILQKLISIDTAVLSAKTQVEVREFRKEQQEWHTAEENQTILKWLHDDSQLDFSKIHQDALSKLHAGTGEWFLESDEFVGWRDGEERCPPNLWCPGIPGAGKTVLVAKTVNHLQRVFPETNVAILFLYCDYKDNQTQTDRNLLANLAKQAVLQQSDCPPEAAALYSQCSLGKKSASLEEYVALLKASTKSFQRTFIIVDALDEHLVSDENEDDAQVPLLHHLYDLQQQTPQQFSIMITSREIDSIRNEIRDTTRLEIRAHDEDIRMYTESRIHNNFPFVEKVKANSDLANEIVERMVEKAHGMFLLPRLHLDRLAKQISVRNLRKALDELPSKLDDIFNDAMTRIGQQDEEHYQVGLRTLSWISKAKRPLLIDELQHAVSIELTDKTIDDESLVSTALIVSACQGLITVNADSNTFRLVHFTVEEFFKKYSHKWFPDADKVIAQVCLVYMQLEVWDLYTGALISYFPKYAKPCGNGLMGYAANYWVHHASLMLPDVESMVRSFLAAEDKVAVAFALVDGIADTSDRFPAERVPGLNFLAGLGFINLVQFWLSSGADVDARDSYGNTPLMVSAVTRNRDVSRLLLRHEADINAVNKDGEDALIKCLGSNEYRDGEGYEFFKFLIDEGADIDGRHPFNGKLLMSAVNQFSMERLQFLLNAGADPNAKDNQGQTPLHYAFHNIDRYTRCRAEWLLKAGADINAKDDQGLTCLHYVADFCGDQTYACELMDFLLEAGADMDICDQRGYTPLLRCLAAANPQIARLLLQKDGKIDFTTLDPQDTEPPILIAVKDTAIDTLLSVDRSPIAKVADETAAVDVAGTPFTKDINDFLLQGDVDLNIKELVREESQRAPKTAILLNSPRSIALDLACSLLRSGVQAEASLEIEESVLIEALEKRVKGPTQRLGWSQYSTWTACQSLLQAKVGNMMPIAAKLGDESDGNVQLLILWGLNRQLRQRLLASIEPFSLSDACEQTDWTLLKTDEGEADELEAELERQNEEYSDQYWTHGEEHDGDVGRHSHEGDDAFDAHQEIDVEEGDDASDPNLPGRSQPPAIDFGLDELPDIAPGPQCIEDSLHAWLKITR